jgi:hypothetical protein
MKQRGAIQRDDGGWCLPIEHRGVSRCAVDHAFVLEFHEGAESTVVRIEGEFTIVERGQACRLTPSEPRGLGPAVALFGQVVSSARVSEKGRLEIAFDDGRSMRVEPDTRYEAWEFFGPGGMRAVCAPGGTISVWQPKDDAPA